MEKRTFTIIIIAIVSVFIISVIKYCYESNVFIPEPWFFSISYIKDGKLIETDLSKENFGKTLRISVDENTGISIGIASSKDFKLTESVFTVIEDDEVIHEDCNTHMGNVWWHLKDRQSAIASINCGTERKPIWVDFKIETVVE